MQDSVSGWNLGHIKDLPDILWYMDVHDLFTDLLRYSLPDAVRYRAPLPGWQDYDNDTVFGLSGLEPTRMRWKDDRVYK